MLIAVERYEWCTLSAGLHHDLATLDLIGIEGVHRHRGSEEDIVGNIDDVVDRTEADGLQTGLQPFWRLAYGHTADGDTRVARTGLGVLYLDADWLERRLQRLVDELVGSQDGVKVGNAWLNQLMRQVMGTEVSIEVACYAKVAGSVNAVWSDIHSDDIIALYMIIFCGCNTQRCVFWQHDDTGMVGSDANLVFSADHTVRWYAAKLGLLDGERLVTVIKHSAERSYDDFLSGSYVRSTADDLCHDMPLSGDLAVGAVCLLHPFSRT